MRRGVVVYRAGAAIAAAPSARRETGAAAAPGPRLIVRGVNEQIASARMQVSRDRGGDRSEGVLGYGAGRATPYRPHRVRIWSRSARGNRA
jgi:hypothetical protein